MTQAEIDEKTRSLALELAPCCVNADGQLDKEKLRKVQCTVDEYKYMCLEGFV